jgi:signal transduction histidine kinase
MEAIGNLAGGIAHDFNNILSSIIGFTELALDETSKGTLLEDSLQEVYSAGKRAKDLVKQILAFARQSDEKMGPIQPRVIVKEVLNFIRSTIPTTIEIQENIESESLILGNATQVHQVLMNLCTNAAYAMEDSGGTLNLSLKDVFVDKEKLSIGMKPGDYVEIKVVDTGTGIPPEIIDSIFEPYFTTKAHGEGTGIGLAMVQGVVESYGGKIAVDSQMGKGTTFTIYLPITKNDQAQDAYVPEELPTGTERILFVDDEAPIAKMGSQILERLGYSVTTRTSSIEALRTVSDQTK